jgi:hypothetical protein
MPGILRLESRVKRLESRLPPRCQKCGRAIGCDFCAQQQKGLDSFFSAAGGALARLTVPELRTLRGLLEKADPDADPHADTPDAV